MNDDVVTVDLAIPAEPWEGGYVQSPDGEAYKDDCVAAGWALGETPNHAFPAIDAILPDWTSEHRGDGVVTGYLTKLPVKEKNFLSKF